MTPLTSVKFTMLYPDNLSMCGFITFYLSTYLMDFGAISTLCVKINSCLIFMKILYNSLIKTPFANTIFPDWFTKLLKAG